MIRLTLSLLQTDRATLEVPLRTIPLCLTCVDTHEVALWTLRRARRPCEGCGKPTRVRAYSAR